MKTEYNLLKKASMCVFAMILTASTALMSSCGASMSYDEADANGAFYPEADNYKAQSYVKDYSGDSFSYEDAEDMPLNGVYDESGSIDISSPLADASTRKIIYSSWANIQTKEYDKTISDLKALCEEYGAYFESSNSYGNRLDYTQERSSEYVIRVPVEKYVEFTGKVGSIGSVVESGENNEDVTEQYIDTEARLESAKLREERVLVILENANNLDDVLALERELSDIRYEIESMTGNLRKLDSLISYATFRLNIQEVVEYTAPGVVPKKFSERLAQNFSDGWRDFAAFWQNFVISLSYNVFGILTFLIFAGVIALIIVLSINGARRKRIKNAERLANAINQQNADTKNDKK